ncbi:MAG TPA: (2Fe-2S)-binding protein [Gemmatimonadaceae bacterium]|nr:(2Fe-2S)-binding protein [Gemmatimonadaceae bacterium]
MMRIELTVNGERHAVNAEPDQSLLSVLREALSLTGAKPGCGEGECGACTVRVGANAVRACTTPVSAVVGHAVTTIEGLEQDGHLHPLQQAFLDEGALQCGYCTPGMIMAAAVLLDQMPAPSVDDIVRGMQGNICRCGGYPRIIAAIRRAAHTTTGG